MSDQNTTPEPDVEPKPKKKAAPKDGLQPDGSYIFRDLDDHRHTLPARDEDTLGRVPFRFTRRAVMNPGDEDAQLALGFAILDAVGAPEATLDALDSLPTTQAAEVFTAWLGESAGSSD